jgi:hypothetical protein
MIIRDRESCSYLNSDHFIGSGYCSCTSRLLRKAKHSRDSIGLQSFPVKRLSRRKFCEQINTGSANLLDIVSRIVLTCVLRVHAWKGVVAKDLEESDWARGDGVVPLVPRCCKTHSLQVRTLRAEKGEAHRNADSEENTLASEQQF